MKKRAKKNLWIGKWAVVYFYPKDNTPGCTSEALEFSQLYAKFKKIDFEVYGISRDSESSHQKFSEKYDLLFPLLSDSDESICEEFSVIKEKSLYGKKYMGIERSTFLVNPKGQIVCEWRKVKVNGHAAEVLKAANHQITLSKAKHST